MPVICLLDVYGHPGLTLTAAGRNTSLPVRGTQTAWRWTAKRCTGGFNVYPTEVEHVLARHPGVSPCAVAGVPDADWGEAVTAFVVRANASMTAEELVRHSRSALTAYKSPKRVVFVDALPRNAMGKVQKKALVSGLAAESPKSA